MTVSAQIDLVIFDADGVLVDSETIALEVLARAAREAGAEIDDLESVNLFRGLKIADCVVEIERRARRAVPERFITEVRAATAAAFEVGLKPVAGVRSALARIRHPVCVASNGPMMKLDQTLRLTRLHRRFAGRVFSAYEVGVWKPDPGLFLHAARMLGADPARCVVVEDSSTGVQAGIAAGMRVLGYAAEAGMAAELREAGAEVFAEMRVLPTLLGSMEAR